MAAGTPQTVGGTPRKTSVTCIAIADAAPIISGVTFQIVKNSAAITGGAGTGLHEGNGVWSYMPSAAEIDTEGTLLVVPVSSGMVQVNSLCPINASAAVLSGNAAQWADGLWYQASGGIPYVAWPDGERYRPLNILSEIKTLGEAENVKKLNIIASSTQFVPADAMQGWEFISQGGTQQVTASGGTGGTDQRWEGFEIAGIGGIGIGAVFSECRFIGFNPASSKGYYNCIFHPISGNAYVISTSPTSPVVEIVRCVGTSNGQSPLGPTVVLVSASNTDSISVKEWSGPMELSLNTVGSTATQYVNVQLDGGTVTITGSLGNSVTYYLTISGSGHVVDETTSGTGTLALNTDGLNRMDNQSVFGRQGKVVNTIISAPTTTQFECDLEGNADSFYANPEQAILWTSGALNGMTYAVTASQGATANPNNNTLLTVETMPLVPALDDTFIILGTTKALV